MTNDIVTITITNMDERADSLLSFGRAQPGCVGSLWDPQPTAAIFKFVFDTQDNANTARREILTFAQGLGYFAS